AERAPPRRRVRGDPRALKPGVQPVEPARSPGDVHADTGHQRDDDDAGHRGHRGDVTVTLPRGRWPGPRPDRPAPRPGLPPTSQIRGPPPTRPRTATRGAR